MNPFDGRPDLLIIFISQIAFIVVQMLIYLRITRGENIFQAFEEKPSRVSPKKSVRRSRR
ncbi:MAG: hypothetical protein FJY86_02610 [Candidatus Diapherotrites archaeon]|uniref:Uncharacterized protein n=1 Tax=Candidatus Iainarchaeum sp. TaxID=3101447 RepID=A0A8T4CB73_9ARCH|nr:hypothetical protein [Candidatus Diapherotrites archaeon]